MALLVFHVKSLFGPNVVEFCVTGFSRVTTVVSFSVGHSTNTCKALLRHGLNPSCPIFIKGNSLRQLATGMGLLL